MDERQHMNKRKARCLLQAVARSQPLPVDELGVALTQALQTIDGADDRPTDYADQHCGPAFIQEYLRSRPRAAQAQIGGPNATPTSSPLQHVYTESARRASDHVFVERHQLVAPCNSLSSGMSPTPRSSLEMTLGTSPASLEPPPAPAFRLSRSLHDGRASAEALRAASPTMRRSLQEGRTAAPDTTRTASPPWCFASHSSTAQPDTPHRSFASLPSRGPTHGRMRSRQLLPCFEEVEAAAGAAGASSASRDAAAAALTLQELVNERHSTGGVQMQADGGRRLAPAGRRSEPLRRLQRHCSACSSDDDGMDTEAFAKHVGASRFSNEFFSRNSSRHGTSIGFPSRSSTDDIFRYDDGGDTRLGSIDTSAVSLPAIHSPDSTHASPVMQPDIALEATYAAGMRGGVSRRPSICSGAPWLRDIEAAVDTDFDASKTDDSFWLLDGEAAAAKWLSELHDAAHTTALLDRRLSMAVVVVGEQSESLVALQQSCVQMRISMSVIRLDSCSTNKELLDALDSAAANPSVDGMLLQFPLPPHVDQAAAIARIAPHKDIGCVHPNSLSRACAGQPSQVFLPSPVLSTIAILQQFKVDLHDKSAVVVGDAKTFALPLTAYLRDAGIASTTVWPIPQHSVCDVFGLPDNRARTSASSHSLPAATQQQQQQQQQHGFEADTAHVQQDFEQLTILSPKHFTHHIDEEDGGGLLTLTRAADVVIFGVDCQSLFRADWVKPGAIVVAAGVNVPSASESPVPRAVVRACTNGISQSYLRPTPAGTPTPNTSVHAYRQCALSLSTAALVHNLLLAGKRAGSLA